MNGRIVWMFCLLAALFGAGQFNRVAGSIMTPVIDHELGLGAAAVGTAMAVYYVAGALMQIPAGLWFDRFGVRLVLPALLAVSVAGTVIFATAESSAALILGRLLIGSGYASTLVAAFVIFARWVPQEKFATVSAALLAAGSIGGICGTAPLAWLIGEIGWRHTFVGVAGLTTVLLVAAALVLRNAPPGYRASGRPPANLRESLSGLRDVLRHRDMRYLLILSLVTYGPQMTVLGLWGGAFLGDTYGLDNNQRGLVLLALATINALSLLLWGPLDRLLDSRKTVAIAAYLLQGGLFIAIAASAGQGLAWTLALLCLLAATFGGYVVVQSHCRALFPDSMVGRANTSLNLAAILGVAAMQWLSSLIVGALPAGAAGGLADPDAYRLAFGAIGLTCWLAVGLYTRVRDVRPSTRR